MIIIKYIKMEFISASQLQKYEGIIEKIKSEFEKYEFLKKDLERENDNLIIFQLANNTITQKLSHLNILVFDKFTDLLNLYGEELHNDFFTIKKTDHCKFYLIEIYITKSLMQKARGLKCMVHIIVKRENININKTVKLRNKSPIREIIIVDDNIVNCIIEANLVVPSEFKLMTVKLDTVYVDMSYHFHIINEKPKSECKVNNIVQISERYHKGVINQDLQKLLTLEMKMSCEVEIDYFISTMLKNCYHILDLELFLELKNNADKEFILNFSLGMETFNLKFNKREKYLKLEGNIYNLCLLKKYFSKQFYQNTDINQKLTWDVLKKLKTNENISQVPDEVCTFLCEVRDSWSKLPI